MNRAYLRDAATLSPVEIAQQREAEAKALVLSECRAVQADAAALLDRCDQLVRLNAVPPGYAAAVREVSHELRRRVPMLLGILTTQDA